MPALSTLVTAAVLLLSTVRAYGPAFTGRPVVSGYYAGYADLSVDHVPYALYTHLTYFVFTSTPNPAVIDTAGIDPSVIRKFVQLAHGNGTQVSFSFGGYTGSNYISDNVNTDAKRWTLARTLVDTMTTYGFDGIDIDWEYPGENSGYPGQMYDPANDAIFLNSLLYYIRWQAPNVRLSMATTMSGVMAWDGKKFDTYSAWHGVLDYLVIMSYDTYGYWSDVTGPNSPLYTCRNNLGGGYSIEQSVNMFITRGFPANQLIIGTPAYGYTYTVQTPPSYQTCYGQTGTYLAQRYVGGGIGTILFKSMAAQGLHTQAGAAAGGFNFYNRDASAKSLGIWSQARQLFILFDDDFASYYKAQYAVRKGVAGLSVFDLSGDSADWAIVRAINLGIGYNSRTRSKRSAWPAWSLPEGLEPRSTEGNATTELEEGLLHIRAVELDAKARAL